MTKPLSEMTRAELVDEVVRLQQCTADLRKLAYIGEHLFEDCTWKFRFSELKAERDALARDLEAERYHRQAVERSERILAERVDRLMGALELAHDRIALLVGIATDRGAKIMEYGYHWTVEGGGYIPDNEEAAEGYVNDRHAEGGEQ